MFIISWGFKYILLNLVLAILSTRIIGQTDFYAVDGHLSNYSNSMEVSCMTYVVDILVTCSDSKNTTKKVYSDFFILLFKAVEVV